MAAKIALWAIRLVLAGVLIYAGAVKIWPAEDFARSIQHYAIVPWPSVTALLAVYVPWVEIFAGASILTRRFYLGGLGVSAALMLIFLAAITSAWARGLDITCGCFGKEEHSIRTEFPRLIGQDVALLGGVLVLLAAERRARR